MPPRRLSTIKVRRCKVRKLLLGLDPSKATGSDKVPALFLKNCADILCIPLTKIFRLSLKLGYFPSAWKLADIVALHKKGSRSEVSNYRPISLLAIMSKLLETLVSDQLKVFLAPLLDAHQFGFRPAHTTLDMLLQMSQRWTDALASGHEVRSIALDISKAFDKVWYDGLLYKLASLGITGPLLAWFKSYLSNRSQRVMVGSSISGRLPLHAGVPQGSVLGPILFLVFINDLFPSVQNHLDVFADDSTFWAVIPSRSARTSVATSLNSDLKEIQAWAMKWLVTYNHTKTELVTFSRSRDMYDFRRNGLDKHGNFQHSPVCCPHPSLTFCGTTLPESPSFKIVGVLFAFNLSRKAHISYVHRNAKRNMAFLKRARRYFNAAAISNLYKTHVRAAMEYCCPLWLALLAPLEQIQKSAIKLMGWRQGKDLQLLQHRRGVAALSVFHRILYSLSPVALHDLRPCSAPTTRSTSRATRPPVFARPGTNKPNYWLSSFIPFMTSTWNKIVPTNLQTQSEPQKFKSLINSSLDLSFLHPRTSNLQYALHLE